MCMLVLCKFNVELSLVVESLYIKENYIYNYVTGHCLTLQ